MGAEVRVSENGRRMETIWTYPDGMESLVSGSYRPDDHAPFSDEEIAETEKWADRTKAGPQECTAYDPPEDDDRAAPMPPDWGKCKNFGAYHLLTASDGMREYLCERHARTAVETDDRIAIKVTAARDAFNFIFDLMFEGPANMDEVAEIRGEAARLYEQMIFPVGYGKRRIEEHTPVNPAGEGDR